MTLESVAYCGVGDSIADICECTLDSVIAASRIGFGKFQCEIDDDLANSRSTDSASAPRAVVPFHGDQLSMTPQDRVGRKERAEFSKQLASEYFAFNRQSTALIIVEQDSSLAEFLLENSILSHQILDDFLLLAVDPAREHDETQLPRLKNKRHDCTTEEVRSLFHRASKRGEGQSDRLHRPRLVSPRDRLRRI